VSQPAPKSSAQRKLDWAEEHLKPLAEEARTFEHSDAYVLRTETNPAPGQGVEYRCFAVERDTVDERWSLMAGDIIQNMRNALDHLVWAAAKRPSNRTQFPIFTDECEFKVLGRRNLQGIPEAMRTTIEEAQPYKMLPANPAIDLLETLRVLSNGDKHHTLAVVAASLNMVWLGSPGPDVVSIEWHDHAEGKPLHDGAPVTHFTAYPTSEGVQVNVNPGISYQVTIEGGFPLVSTLEVIGGRVREIIRLCS